MILSRSAGANRQRVVVTGASGFVGRALVAELRAAGHEVVAMSRAQLPGADYRRMDRIDDAVLVHLAEPRDLQAAEAAGTQHIANVTDVCSHLVGMGWRHVIYASSAAVYGDATSVPHVPTNHVAPAGIYGRAKVACEQIVLAAGGTVVRMSNIYGPGMAPNNVVSHILSQIPGQGPLTMRAVTPVRDFLWIGDTATALSAMIERQPGGILNLGSGLSVAVGQVASLALRLAGQGARSVAGNLPPDTPSQLYLDIARTVDVLDWCPLVSLEQGLRILVDERHRTAEGVLGHSA